MNTCRCRNSRWVILLVMAMAFSHVLQAQSIRGKVIYISSQPVKFKFGSKVTDYGFTERTQASLFKVDVSKKNLSISNIGGNFKTANFVVTEGANAHLFILYYDPSVSEETYDLSTPELLKAEIEGTTKRNIQKADPPVQTVSVPLVKQDTAVVISKPVEATDTVEQQLPANSVVTATKTDSLAVKKMVETAAVPRPQNNPTEEVLAGNETTRETTRIAAIPKEQPEVKKPVENTFSESKPLPPRPQSNLRTDAITADQGANTPNIPVTASSAQKTETPSKPKPDGSIIIMSGPAAKRQRKDSIIFLSGVDKKRLENKPAVRVAQQDRKDSIILMNGGGKLSAETNSPSKSSSSFEDHYNQLIHLGDSTAWIAKDYESSLRWYDSAQKLSPYASYPLKQKNAVRAVLKEQAEAAKTIRSQKFTAALSDYKTADALRVERKFADAYRSYSKFLSQVDSTKLNEYKSSELYYINQAKDYLVRLQPYLPKAKPQAAPAPVQENGKKRKGRAAGH